MARLAFCQVGPQDAPASRSGTAHLEEAVTTFRDALKEYTREHVPLDGAMTPNNLGNALRTLGDRESSTARLEEAITALRDALKEGTREQVPLDWAVTHNNLGIALRALGERESGTAHPEEALETWESYLIVVAQIITVPHWTIRAWQAGTLMHNTVHEFEWVPHLIFPYLVDQLGIGGDEIHLYRASGSATTTFRASASHCAPARAARRAPTGWRRSAHIAGPAGLPPPRR
jgi:tetratricopeptide (TPR) repeat protein